MTTDYHAKLFARELLRCCPLDNVERFTAILMDSQVDLNPHQIDAALFAFRSPFSKGAILADEVGLGKTIEAGIVLSQKWVEDKCKSLKTTLKDYDDEIAELKKQARIVPNLPEKLGIQKKIRRLDKKRNDAWHEYDTAAGDIEKKKDSLIDQVEKRLQQNITEESLFTIRWKLI